MSQKPRLGIDGYRENGKVRKRTIANLSHLPGPTIKAMPLVLQRKARLTARRFSPGRNTCWIGYRSGEQPPG